MIKARKIRLNPAPEQENYFRKAAGAARFVYNWGLAEWKRRKAEQPDQAYGVMAVKKKFNALKAEQFPWVYEAAKDGAEGAFASLAAAFKNYYDSKNGKRQGPKAGFPRFKSKKRKRQSFRLNNDKIAVEGHNFYAPKLGRVNMAEPLRLEGKIMGAAVSQTAGRWCVSIAVKMNDPEPASFSKPSAGVDPGVRKLAVLSDGVEDENQAPLRSELKRLKRLSRRLSRRQVGNSRWYRAKRQLERFHERIANRRADYLHKMTTQIARTYEVIGLEDLNVSGMLKNRRLALSISDASFGEIRRQLTCKSRWFGGRVVTIAPCYPSSRRCFDCGALNTELEPSDRTWTCANCAAVHERDQNAARNIEVEALRLVHIHKGRPQG